MRNGYFIFGTANSADLGIVLTEPPAAVFAEREVETVSVAGRSGDLILDSGRYKNVTIPYSCAVIPNDVQTFRQTMAEAVSALRPDAEYRRLENSFHSDTFRMARVKKQISAKSMRERGGVFTIEFDCRPQRFLKEGEEIVSFAAAGTISNPTAFQALPLITVYGAEAGTVSVNGVTVEILAIEDQITLDCEMQNAYRQVGDSPAENCNNCIYASEFPVLCSGVNGVSFDGGITSVDIIPRWWEL